MEKVLSVAYLGDAVYELYIRNYLFNSGVYDNGLLQKKSLLFVSARSQRKILEQLINNNILSEKELDYIRTGRNAKGARCKNSDIVTYRMATGLEYLFGKLYLENEHERIKKIFEKIVGEYK